MVAIIWVKSVRIWIVTGKAFRPSLAEKSTKEPTKPTKGMDTVRSSPLLNEYYIGYASFPSGQIIIGEYKEGKRDGKMTVYGTNGTVKNKVKYQGDTVSKIKVKNPEDAWFGCGSPHNKEPGKN